MRRIIMNAVIPPPDGGIIIVGPRAPLSEALTAARAFAGLADESFVGHPSTAHLLGVPPSRGQYVPREGDLALVASLASRPAVSGGDVDVRPDDLVVRLVFYAGANACWCGDSGCLGDYLWSPGQQRGTGVTVRGDHPRPVLSAATAPQARIGCIYAPAAVDA